MAVAAVTAALALVPSAQAGQSSGVTLGSVPAQVTFSSGISKTSTGARVYDEGFSDPTILAELEGLITRADPGSYIGITIFRIADEGRIERAIREAEADGVSVWIVYGNTDGALNGHPHVKVCPRACLSTQPSGIMHAKFATFTSTHRTPGSAASKAAWVSSANLDGNTGPEAFNNAITWFGHDEIYDRLTKVFQDMWNGPVVTSDYYRPELGEGSGYFNIDAAQTFGYVSPEASADLWYDRLSNIKAPSEGGMSPCVVRVAQAYFGDGLMDKNNDGSEDYNNPAGELARLRHQGCSVAVLGHRKPGTTETTLGSATVAKLCAAGIAVRSIEKLHHKFVISSGSYEGAASSPQVLTGSHNMTLDALRYNDEVLLRIKGSYSTYDLYNGHFNDMWAFSDYEC
jgi:hypothetical protein